MPDNNTSAHPGKLLTSDNLQVYFHEAISDTVEEHHLDLTEESTWYLTQLLCSYSKTENFLDYHEGRTLTPLATYYRLATEASNTREANLYLQKLGDVALFVSGLYPGVFRRRPVSVDYYISMGRTAYSVLAGQPSPDTRTRSLGEIFSDLAKHFPDVALALQDLHSDPETRSALEFNKRELNKHVQDHALVLADSVPTRQ